jgi:hypothetical protein
MLTHRITPQHAENMTRARLRAIELRGLDRAADINTRDFYKEISIKQHSPHGVKEDNIILFMAHDRRDSWNVCDNGLILLKDDGIVKMGTHRFASWMAKEKLDNYGRFDG